MAEGQVTAQLIKDRVAAAPARKPGLAVKRFFTRPGAHPFDEIEWEMRTASIQNEKGQIIFEQRNVEVPKDWSQTATNIVASKYFHGKLGTPRSASRACASSIEPRGGHDRPVGRGGRLFSQRGRRQRLSRRARSTSWFVRRRRSIHRCGSIAVFGTSITAVRPASGWYWDPATGGVKKETEAYRHPQCSACFINSVQDNLESILTLAKTEGMLFKWGSGTGTNLSPLRSSVEPLSGGGVASGPLSFMKGL